MATHTGMPNFALHILHMAAQVGAAGVQITTLGTPSLLRAAAVVLERAHRGNDHHRGGRDAGHAALDVEELFRPEVRPETGLGDDIIGHLHGAAGGRHAVAAVRDVGKRPAVHKRGRVLQRLHQVGAQKRPSAAPSWRPPRASCPP